MATPKTVLTYQLNGAQKDFNIPFEYLARKFVQVTLIGTDRKTLVLNTDYRFSTRTTITTTLAWGAGQGYTLIEIRRYTSATERLVDFSDGSILRAYDLNTAQVQSLHIAEEGRDIATDTIGVDTSGNLDARGRKIINLADAVLPGDAVTFRQEQAWGQSALNQAIASANSAAVSQASRLAAESARDAATVSKNASEVSNLSSKDWATKAEDVVVSGGLYSSYHHSRKSAASAVTSATQAGISATQAGISATQAGISATQAGLSGASATASQAAKSGAEAARDVAISAAAAAAGVGADFISGLIPSRDATNALSITVSSGIAVIPSTGKLLQVPLSGLTAVLGSTTVNTWYYVYLYDSGTNAPALEISTTAPVIYFGTARSKTGNTTRRYLCSLRSKSSGSGFMNFAWTPQGTIEYLESINASPFRVLNQGAPSVGVGYVVDVNTVVPPTTTWVGLMLTLPTAASIYDAYLSSSYGDGTTVQRAFSGGGPVASRAFTHMPTSAGRQLVWKVSAIPAGHAVTLDVFAYGNER